MDIAITVAVTIIALAIGLFFGALPLQTSRMTEEQNRYSQMLSIAGIGMVVVLMIVKMEVASWTVIAAMLAGVLIAKIPPLHRWILTKAPFFAPRPSESSARQGHVRRR